MPEPLPTIPMIDAAQPDEHMLAAEIGRAARGLGFFYLTGHGIDLATITAVFAGAAGFFALPNEIKERQSIKRSPHNRGYVAMKGESLDPGKAADLKEAYNIGLDLAADDPRVVRGEAFRGVNLWPELPNWRQSMLAYYDAFWALGRRLHHGIVTASRLTSASGAISSTTSSTRQWRSFACCTIRRSRRTLAPRISARASTPTTAASPS
jgi:isopenicillin N synthase-like dioxygenase